MVNLAMITVFFGEMTVLNVVMTSGISLKSLWGWVPSCVDLSKPSTCYLYQPSLFIWSDADLERDGRCDECIESATAAIDVGIILRRRKRILNNSIGQHCMNVLVRQGGKWNGPLLNPGDHHVQTCVSICKTCVTDRKSNPNHRSPATSAGLLQQ